MSCCWFHHRLTPAHTGNAITNVKRSHLMHGSPPRIRGTRRRYALRCREARLIPTHTGNTLHRSTRRPSVAAHPHAYGEHWSGRVHEDPYTGSSPRIRGTQRGTRTTPGKHRLIPTHTGNTPDKYAGKNAQAAHPHAYGEHAGQSKPGGRDKGSSPRIRGTHLPTKHNTQPKSKKYSVSTRIHI